MARCASSRPGERGAAVLVGQQAGFFFGGGIGGRFEAGQALVECFRPDGGACCRSPDCRLKGVLWQARGAFLASLDARTLADCLVPPAA